MPRSVRLADDLAVCRRVLRAGSKSFAMAARWLPRRVREPATVLYAFCRVADDAIDMHPGATDETVDVLRRRLDLAYAGRPANEPVDRALATVLERERIPRSLPDALLEGLSWDAQGRRYATLAELHAYGARVAGAVGAMMTLVMGRRSPEVLARACDLGVAMQLTNIARDVGEDARRGRIYLPLDWLVAAGVDPDRWLLDPQPGPLVGSVVARLIDEAASLYVQADSGIALLPGDCRRAIGAARLIYSDLGRAIARAGFDTVTHRAFVGGWRKSWLLARALSKRWRVHPELAAPPLESTRFLVAACVEAV